MYEITMPKLSDTMTEGTLVAWRKDVGDQVKRGEIIAEVETDKATMELEAFADGELLEIRIEPGQPIAVGTVIGIIGEAGESSAKKTPPPEKGATESTEKAEPKPPSSISDQSSSVKATKSKSALSDGNQVEAVEKPPAKPSSSAPSKSKATTKPKASSSEERELETAPPSESKSASTPAETATSAVTPPPTETQASKIPAAPVVRARAKELGIDLTKVKGSGPDGRIMLEDLSRPEATQEPPSPTTTEGEGAATSTGEDGQPLSAMRVAIARTVSESWRTIPHFSATVEVRMDAAEQFRRQLKENGVEVSVTALLIKTVTLALVKFPRLNASFRDEQMIVHPEINIGIMVGLEDGLLVPVLKDCDELSIEEIMQRAEKLIARARNKKLSEKELVGGTFAISNLGMYEVLSFNALIQPPMSAILAVGALHEGVIAKNGQVAVAQVMSLTLSVDHRVADGVYAAKFLQDVKHLLEETELLKKDDRQNK